MNARLAAAWAFVAVAGPAAADPWVTLHDGEQDAVAVLGSGGPDTVLTQQSIAVYGESATRIAVVAYSVEAAQYQLRIVDKQSRQPLHAWPVPATPVRQLAGAAPDVVLHDDEAFLLAHSSRLEAGAAPTRNARGGTFDVIRIALRTGEVGVLPLGDAFANPRLHDFDGIPVVTDWAGYSVWRLSAAGSSMEGVVTRDDVLRWLPGERAERERRTLPFAARADFAVVPGAGVYRMSLSGTLSRVTDEQLRALSPPFASLTLGPAQFHERFFAATTSNGPAIAVVRREADRRTLTFVDARRLEVKWRRELPGAFSPWSLVAAGPDAVIGIDTASGALVRVRPDRIEPLRILPSGQFGAGSRIVSAGDP